MSQFDPFSPEFGGAVVDGGATTTTTKSSPAESLPLDLLTPSMSKTTTGGGVDLLSMDPFAPKQQSSGLATFETKGAYGGVTWTSPLEKKYATGRPKEDDLLSVLATSVTTAVPPPLPQKSTTTGLSCLASPPPLPNSSLDSGSVMMGGNTGTGFSTPPPLPTGTSQALTTTTTTTDVNPEEDEEFLQAQQAAMEAKAMMEKLALQQKKKEEEGFLGLGHLIPKPPNFFAPTDATTNKTATAANPWFQSASPTRDTGTPPWHPSLQEGGQHAAVSDFGIPPSTVANPTASSASASGTGAAIMGASVVGGVAGLMLVGPLVGIVAAGGAAYAAGTKEGPVGSILRGTGSLAASAGGAAKRFDDEHQILAKSVKGIASGVGWIVKTVNGNTPDH